MCCASSLERWKDFWGYLIPVFGEPLFTVWVLLVLVISLVPVTSVNPSLNSSSWLSEIRHIVRDCCRFRDINHQAAEQSRQKEVQEDLKFPLFWHYSEGTATWASRIPSTLLYQPQPHPPLRGKTPCQDPRGGQFWVGFGSVLGSFLSCPIEIDQKLT